MPGVLILDTRPITRAEAIAVGRALAARNITPRYLDAHLRVNAAIAASKEGGAVEEGLPAAHGVLDKIKTPAMRKPLLRALILLRGILRDAYRLRGLLAQERPAAVVIFDDRRVRPDLVLRTLCGRLGIPTVIVPFAVSTTEADAHVRLGKPEHEIDLPPWRGVKQWVAAAWPGQAQVFQGRRLLFFGLWETLVLALCRMLPSRSWYLGGSMPEVVGALGQDHYDYLIAGGLDRNRIAVTGQASLDAMASRRFKKAAMRRELDARYGLAGSRPLVICAVPQYAEHGLMDWESHRAQTDDLFARLSANEADILLSLHPKSDRRNYATAAERHGLGIIDERLADVLPAADVMVATFSSTVGWAIGLGIPAVVVDAFASNYQLYHDLDGVVIVRNHDALSRELAHLVRDPAARDAAMRRAASGSRRVGHLDGDASSRIAEAIERTIATGSGRVRFASGSPNSGGGSYDE